MTGATTLAFAQVGLSGCDNFPPYRGLSAQPGRAICLMPDGNPGASGALAFSTTNRIRSRSL